MLKLKTSSQYLNIGSPYIEILLLKDQNTLGPALEHSIDGLGLRSSFLISLGDTGSLHALTTVSTPPSCFPIAEPEPQSTSILGSQLPYFGEIPLHTSLSKVGKQKTDLEDLLIQ